MSMFTLAISCLTTSNLPWFMDLTFQVPMQCCSLQHRTLLLSSVTSTTGYCFCFGSISSFFLDLFLYWSPVAYWTPTDLASSSQCPIFLPFHTVHGVLKAKILKWFAISFSSGPHFVKGFGIVNKAEVDVFLELSHFFDDPADVGSLISGFSAFPNPDWTSRSSWFTYCWSLAWRILSIILLVYEMSAIVW